MPEYASSLGLGSQGSANAVRPTTFLESCPDRINSYTARIKSMSSDMTMVLNILRGRPTTPPPSERPAPIEAPPSNVETALEYLNDAIAELQDLVSQTR